MDIQKEKEAFEAWFESRYGAHFMQFALDLDFYVDKHTQTCWEAWQAAKVESHKQAALYQFEINHLAQANQQWREKAAQAQAVPEGFVLVPMVPSERMINAVRQCYEGEAYLPYSLYSEFVNQAIIERMEAQEPTND